MTLSRLIFCCVTFNIMSFSIMSFSIMPLCIMTFSIMELNRITFSIKILVRMTFSIIVLSRMTVGMTKLGKMPFSVMKFIRMTFGRTKCHVLSQVCSCSLIFYPECYSAKRRCAKYRSTKSCLSLTWGRFVEQKLMLSSSFRCDPIYKYERYDFGHTLLCYLSPT